jgi:hypothetical protein
LVVERVLPNRHKLRVALWRSQAPLGAAGLQQTRIWRRQTMTRLRPSASVRSAENKAKKTRPGPGFSMSIGAKRLFHHWTI